MDRVTQIKVTAEIIGYPLSQQAASIIDDDLLDIPDHAFELALRDCRRELAGRLSEHQIRARAGRYWVPTRKQIARQHIQQMRHAIG